MINESNEERRYDFIVVGAGAAGSVLSAELSASGAQVLVIESGGPDDAPTIADPSVWFYNVGGPLAVNAKQRILHSSELNDSERHSILGGNASRLFPHLHSVLADRKIEGTTF